MPRHATSSDAWSWSFLLHPTSTVLTARPWKTAAGSSSSRWEIFTIAKYSQHVRVKTHTELSAEVLQSHTKHHKFNHKKNKKSNRLKITTSKGKKSYQKL
ncbi:hypothetical protein ACJQWK_01635 [Exserohilum turcicum]